MHTLTVMFSVDAKTTFFGITDLRTHAKKMLQSLKDSQVIITERNTPRAVVLDYAEYKKMKDLIEMAEEEMDAAEVKKRKKNNRGRFLSHNQVLNKFDSCTK